MEVTISKSLKETRLSLTGDAAEKAVLQEFVKAGPRLRVEKDVVDGQSFINFIIERGN